MGHRVTLRSADCGNSPKNQFVADLTVALVRSDFELVRQSVTAQVQCHWVGHAVISGRDAVVAQFTALLRAVEETEIYHVLTHGKTGAVTGAHQRSGKVYDFCVVFEFTNAKGTQVQAMTYYMIERRRGGE